MPQLTIKPPAELLEGTRTGVLTKRGDMADFLAKCSALRTPATVRSCDEYRSDQEMVEEKVELPMDKKPPSVPKTQMSFSELESMAWVPEEEGPEVT